MNNVQKFLKKAKGKLTAKTWVNHPPQKHGEFCCLTAFDSTEINVANTSWLKAQQAFREAINDVCIPHWNDSPKRTLQQVHAAFDKAIKLAAIEFFLWEQEILIDSLRKSDIFLS